MTTVEEKEEPIAEASPAKQAKLAEAESSVGSLRSEAIRRKERLIELRKMAQNKGLSTTSVALDTEGELPKPIFRNYKPVSDELKPGQLPEGSIVNFTNHHFATSFSNPVKVGTDFHRTQLNTWGSEARSTDHRQQVLCVFTTNRPAFSPISPDKKPAAVDVHVAEQLEAAKAQSVVDEVNLFNLAPRKPDWDLKRGVEKKLRKLERRTQRVIAELIRE
ncbi:unnamed protein product [Mesocestoides corti]|uniref:Coiled-coil domain-containing protein 12 n=1 Tax=Mesocestoides corti TaxID=53468 RepID=A0A0R3UEP5_MESCO|nr:unnamed protein product [Mesocestoides corti]